MAIMGVWICSSAPTKLLYTSQDKYAARLYDFKVWSQPFGWGQESQWAGPTSLGPISVSQRCIFLNLIVGLSITHSVILMFQAIWLVRHLGVIEWITRYPNKTNLAGVNLPFEVLIKSTLKGFLHLMIAIRWIFFFCKSRFQTIIVNWKHASLFRGVPHVFFFLFPTWDPAFYDFPGSRYFIYWFLWVVMYVAPSWKKESAFHGQHIPVLFRFVISTIVFNFSVCSVVRWGAFNSNFIKQPVFDNTKQSCCTKTMNIYCSYETDLSKLERPIKSALFVLFSNMASLGSKI